MVPRLYIGSSVRFDVAMHDLSNGNVDYVLCSMIIYVFL